jgi:long-chain acyl-CoA synthetase
VKRDAVVPNANLELDLGLDSMERVELLATLEDARRVKVPTDVQATIFTVRQLVEAVERAPESDPRRPGTGTGGEPAWQAILTAPPDPDLARELSRSKFVRAALLYSLLVIGRLVAALAIGFRAYGRTNVPEDGPVILAPNHQTYLDGFFIVACLPFSVFRRLFVVGASEYFGSPFKARLARAFNIIPVDPDVNLVGAMQAAATGLGNGRVLVLFPEGERSIDGALKPFRKGAAILASHLDVPVVPTAVNGFFPLWPRGRPFNWRGLFFARHNTSVVFGEPLHLRHRDEIAGTRELERAVAALLGARADERRRRTAAL